MRIDELHGKKILILGYGKEGKATKRFLKKFVKKAVIDTTDQIDGPNYLDKQKRYDLVIKSPGVPRRLVTIPYTTATNLFFANLPEGVRTVGVTGSKGKSTTTSLIYRVLKGGGLRTVLAGNIGKPMLAELMKPVKSDTIFVLELSSYQLEDIAYTPNVSVILNVFPEHLDYHGSYDAYVRAKKRIVAKAKVSDMLVYNADSVELSALAKKTQATTVPIPKSFPMPTDFFPLRGKHNELNMRATLVVGGLFNVPEQIALEAMRRFQPLPHRMEFIGKFRGIKFYDDAIATAPEPTIHAIETIGDVDTIFLGGTDRGLDFTTLAQAVSSSGIRNIVLFPDTGTKIMELIRKYSGHEYRTLETRSMKDAVRFAYEQTRTGASCLLSTASPSYSNWKNFEEKGDEFRRIVEKLG